jgi:hypothetical protein
VDALEERTLIGIVRRADLSRACLKRVHAQPDARVESARSSTRSVREECVKIKNVLEFA